MENQWSKDNIRKFLNLMQRNQCLYNIKSKEYMDREKKAQAFIDIKNEMDSEMAGVTVNVLKKKWRSLKTQYLRECRLIKHCMKSGSRVGDMYQPRMWCFEQLNFLECCCASRSSLDRIESSAFKNVFAKSSTLRVEDTNEEIQESKAKRTRRFKKLSGGLQTIKETIAQRKENKPFAWLSTLVESQMTQIDEEYQEDAAWEIQKVIRKYIVISERQRTTSTSSSSANFTSAPSFASNFASVDLLQLSQDGVFDPRDADI